MNNSERFANFLNTIYFKPNNMEILELGFLIDEFNEINQLYNFKNLRADIACRGIINNCDKKETHVLIDVEIHSHWLENIDDRLFEIGSLLRNYNTNNIRIKQKIKEAESENKKSRHIERTYYDTIVIAFILDSQNISKNSNNNKLIKKEVIYILSKIISK